MLILHRLTRQGSLVGEVCTCFVVSKNNYVKRSASSVVMVRLPCFSVCDSTTDVPIAGSTPFLGVPRFWIDDSFSDCVEVVEVVEVEPFAILRISKSLNSPSSLSPTPLTLDFSVWAAKGPESTGGDNGFGGRLVCG